MTKIYYILILFTVSLSAQNINFDTLLYSEATSYYNVYKGASADLLPTDDDREIVASGTNERYCLDKAYEGFMTIVEKYPESIHYQNALYYVGHLNYEDSRYAESKMNLLELIQAKEEYGFFTRLAYFDLAEIAI